MIGKPRRLVLVGSVIGDAMVRVPHIPDRGGDVMGTSSTARSGGGFVAMSAAARLGLPAALAGRLGTGPIATLITNRLRAEGMEILLPAVEGEQGLAFGMVEPDGERTFVTAPGVESGLTRAELDAVRVGPQDAIVVSGYDLLYPVAGPAIMSWVQELPPQTLLFFDPGPLVAEIPEELLDVTFARADVVGLNRREVGLLTGFGPDAERQAEDWLFQELKRPDVMVLIRDGAAGCRLCRRGAEEVRFPSPAVEVVDTTGAGDVHTGAFLAELARGADAVEAARVATIAAGMSVREAVSAGGPTREALDSFMASPAGQQVVGA